MKQAWLLLLCIALPLSSLAAPKFKSVPIKDSRPAGKGKPGYKIEAEYPVFPPPMPAAGNAAAKAVVTNQVEAFKKDYVKDAQGEIGWDIEVNFNLEYSNSDLVSLVYADSTYEGGAHPAHSQRALLLSPKTGKAISLAQCFRPGSPWLKTLSTYCIKSLKDGRELEATQIEDGASPKAENYRDVAPTAKGLRVYFQEYQVGPYAAGPQQVDVPYSVVKDLIAPDGPLKAFR